MATRPMNRRRGWLALDLDDTAILGALIFGFAMLVWLPSIANGFVWDDVNNLVSSERLTKFSAFFEVFLHDAMWSAERDQAAVGTYRPIALASFVLDFQIWGRRAAGFHFTSILWHALATFAVFRACLRWASPRAAWMIAALWCAHPVNAEAVAWVNGRSETFAVLFGASAIALVSNGKDGLTPLRWLGAAVCLSLALFSKETGLIFVPVVVMLAAEAHGTTRPRWWAGFGIALTAAIVGVAGYLYLRNVALTGGVAAGVEISDKSYDALPSIWMRSMRTAILPAERSLQHLSLWLQDLPNDFKWVYRIGSGVMVLLGLLLLFTKRRVAAMGLAWWLGALVPVCLIAVRAWPGYYRWLVIGLPGLLLFGYRVGRGLPNRLAWAGSGVLLMAAIVWTQFSIPVWRTGGSLFGQMVEEHPEISYGYIGLGAWMLEVGNNAEAEKVLRTATELRNPRPDAFMFLARAISALDRCDEAVEMAANRVAGNIPGHVAYSLGRCYHVNSQWAKAVEAYDKCDHYVAACKSQLPVVQAMVPTTPPSDAPATVASALDEDIIRVVGTVASEAPVTAPTTAPASAAASEPQ